jgi:hypothetical protein
MRLAFVLPLTLAGLLIASACGAAADDGPCATPALSSIADRPGIGRAPATGGAVCVASSGEVVLGLGYRDQSTVGPNRQELLVYPEPVLTIGLPGRSELIVAPSLAYSRRIGGGVNANLPPLSGLQDAGVGFQHLMSDRPFAQQAIEVFASFPTGYPSGANGFSAGVPNEQASYTIALALSSKLGLTISQGIGFSSGFNAANAVERYVAYQPSASISYALGNTTTLLLEDQINAPSGPHALTGNRFLVGLQQTISPTMVLDIDSETNALPPPGFSQHTTFEAGITFRL